MKFNTIKKIILAAAVMFTFSAFAQNANRDVPYTKELLTFINSYFSHNIASREQAEKLYNAASSKIPADFTEYQKETTLSRCDYFFGQYIMETYDLTQLEHALDDTSKEFEDPVERNKRLKAEASKYYVSGMDHALKAMEMKGDEASDAMVAYATALSGNIVVSTVGYLLQNGTKIAQYAKKAAKVDPKNGTACYLLAAQACYAPGIFGNPAKGYKMMLSYLEDAEIVAEKYDRFNYACAIAYTYYRQNKFEQAKQWYQKCQEIYPGNYWTLDLMSKCDQKLGAK